MQGAACFVFFLSFLSLTIVLRTYSFNLRSKGSMYNLGNRTKVSTAVSAQYTISLSGRNTSLITQVMHPTCTLSVCDYFELTSSP